MHQNTHHSPGETGSPEIPRITPVPGTLRMRIMPKNSGPKVELTCLPPGGKIKAIVPETLHVDSVDPEPGVGYGWSRKSRDPGMSGLGEYIQPTTRSNREYREIPCS